MLLYRIKCQPVVLNTHHDYYYHDCKRLTFHSFVCIYFTVSAGRLTVAEASVIRADHYDKHTT